MNSMTWLGSRGATAAGALALMLALGGCGGGSGGPATAAAGADGTVLIGLTDADGDFVHYAVDVVSLRLVRADGSVVETLPATGRLDFAAYTELTELFSAATVPEGAYVAGEIMLDYATADVQVEVAGAALPATVVGRDGGALGRQSLGIRLDRDRPLVVAPGRTALLSIDFDLAASHEVDVAASPPVVRTAPFLVAELAPVTEKDLRVRGALQSVAPAAGTYAVQLQPGHLLPARNFGAVTVHTDAATAFDIDGVAYIGAAGLTALAAQPAGTPTVALGTLSPAERRVDAALVVAGSSVPGGRFDTVLGNVVARSGNQLKVRGATLVRPGGLVLYRDDVTVTIGAGTVVRRAPAGSMEASAISVGSRVEVHGTLTSSAGEALALDAAAGRVRLLPTQVAGRVVAVQPGQLDLELLAIDRRPVALFDFGGTGMTPGTDADPASYEVATGDLPLTSLEPGDPAQALGFVAGFGAAPPDFAATSVVALRPAVARLGIGWRPEGTAAPFAVPGPDSLVLDLANPAIGRRALLTIGPVKVPLAGLPAAPAIVAPADGPTRYAIRHGARVLVLRDFASFTAVVNRALGAGAVAYGFSAEGSYDRDGNVLTARVLAMDLSRIATVDE
jgi:hypothetical protein